MIFILEMKGVDSWMSIVCVYQLLWNFASDFGNEVSIKYVSFCKIHFLKDFALRNKTLVKLLRGENYIMSCVFLERTLHSNPKTCFKMVNEEESALLVFMIDESQPVIASLGRIYSQENTIPFLPLCCHLSPQILRNSNMKKCFSKFKLFFKISSLRSIIPPIERLQFYLKPRQQQWTQSHVLL